MNKEMYKTKTLPIDPFILTTEQKVALLGEKVKRAEAHIRALSELSKKLEKHR